MKGYLLQFQYPTLLLHQFQYAAIPTEAALVAKGVPIGIYHSKVVRVLFFPGSSPTSLLGGTLGPSPHGFSAVYSLGAKVCGRDWPGI